MKIDENWEEVSSYCPKSIVDYDNTYYCAISKRNSSNGYDICSKEECPFYYWLQNIEKEKSNVD